MVDSSQDAALREKRSMSLELLGQRFTVVSDNDEASVRDLVDFVNRKLEEVRSASRRVQTDQIALLTALNIAEELFKERHSSNVLRRKVRERSVKLLGAIDSIAREMEAAEAGPEVREMAFQVRDAVEGG